MKEVIRRMNVKKFREKVMILGDPGNCRSYAANGELSGPQDKGQGQLEVRSESRWCQDISGR